MTLFGGAGGKFTRVVDQVTPDSNLDLVWVLFLWAIVNHNLHSYCLVRGDVLDFLMGHEETSVSASSTGLVVIFGEATEFFTKGGGPYFPHDRIIGEFFTFGVGFSSNQMGDGVGKLFKIWHISKFTPFW